MAEKSSNISPMVESPQKRPRTAEQEQDTPQFVEQEHYKGVKSYVRNLQIRTAENELLPFQDKINSYTDEFFPNLAIKTYRVPAVYFQSENLKQRSENADYQELGEVDEATIRGEGAEMRFCDVLESMRFFYSDGGEQPMIIISGFKFENYLCKLKAEIEAGRIGTGSEKYICSRNDGEHDILLLHLNHGVTFFQVKGIEEFKSNETINLKPRRDKHNRKIKDAVGKAIEQLKKDEQFFICVTEDLQCNYNVTKVVVLPNITRKYLDKLDGTKSVLESEQLLNSCLCADEIPTVEDMEETREEKINNFKHWWSNNIQIKPEFDKFEDYKQVIGRYCGLLSVVEIRTTKQEQTRRGGKVEARTEGEAMAELGYRHMRIILTTQQVDILNSNERRLVIEGDYGTGKTVLLILKAREMLKKGEHVCLASGRATCMGHYLYEGVIAGIEHLKDKVRLFQGASLKSILEYLRDTSAHLFYDETWSTFLGRAKYSVADCTQTVDSTIWFVKAHVDIVIPEQVNFKGFKVVNFSKQLRCPERVRSLLMNGDMSNFPIIDHSRHGDVQYYECMDCVNEVHDKFASLGLRVSESCDQDLEEPEVVSSRDCRLEKVERTDPMPGPEVASLSRDSTLEEVERTDPRPGPEVATSSRDSTLEVVERTDPRPGLEVASSSRGSTLEEVERTDPGPGPEVASSSRRHSRLDQVVKAVPDVQLTWSDVLLATPEDPSKGDFVRRLGINCEYPSVKNSAGSGNNTFAMFDKDVFLGHNNTAIATFSALPIMGIERKIVFCMVDNQSRHILSPENLKKLKPFLSRSTSHIIFFNCSKRHN